jgi:squalene-hopene/tetraprenyl-beta-curcumene cyclase
MDIDRAALDRTVTLLKARLLQSRTPAGCWQGQLSSSALSTATAVFALATVDKTKYSSLICKGLECLSANQNPDGGWGDTIHSISNISTTLLCWSAFTIGDAPHRFKDTVTKTELWLTNAAGQGEALHRIKPDVLAAAVNRQYGADRSFSAPILTMCALAGRLGNPEDAWRLIKPLPFELSIFPHQLFKWLHLPVVSYALPALIAIGQVHYHYRKPANPIARALRFLSRNRTLSVLQNLQPENGGFLEAIPLTAFIVMGLAAIGEKNNDVVSKGAEFLVNSARPDGSWPIDTNLATWVTTLSANALSADPNFENILSPNDCRTTQDWLLSSQYRRIHPYTHAAPGGWGWTNLPGAVPDADDTAGALIVLRNLVPPDKYTTDAALSGIEWLLKLQNRDGGIPTFCRGWMSLPFDRSAPDLTAHTIAAVSSWLNELPGSMQKPAKDALRKALAYLERAQKKDGSWIPLWFGNQFSPNQENPTYGTSRVLICLCRLPKESGLIQSPMVQKAAQWLLSAQNQDGGWGGAKGVKSTIEETALSVDALASILDSRYSILDSRITRHGLAVEPAISRGVRWLIEKTEEGESITPSPIGLYFARLWYFEELYPVIFTVSALQKVRNLGSIV